MIVSKNRIRRWRNSYHEFLHTNELMRYRWPVLSEENDDDFKDFCDLFTFYLCTSCSPKTRAWHPSEFDWEWPHHNARLLRLLLPHRAKDPFEGLMAAYAAYCEADDKNFLEETFAEAFIHGHPGLDRTSNLFQTTQVLASHQSDTFICHGIERLEAYNNDPAAQYPPIDSMKKQTIAENGKSYAIETDRLPLINCASSHSIIDPWDYCKGIIPLPVFQQLGGQILLAPDREHFYAESAIPINEWCFVYFRQARRRKGLKFDVDLLRQKITELRSSELRIIEFETLWAFLRALTLLQQKFEMAELMDFSEA